LITVSYTNSAINVVVDVVEVVVLVEEVVVETGTVVVVVVTSIVDVVVSRVVVRLDVLLVSAIVDVVSNVVVELVVSTVVVGTVVVGTVVVGTVVVGSVVVGTVVVGTVVVGTVVVVGELTETEEFRRLKLTAGRISSSVIVTFSSHRPLSPAEVPSNLTSASVPFPQAWPATRAIPRLTLPSLIASLRLEGIVIVAPEKKSPCVTFNAVRIEPSKASVNSIPVMLHPDAVTFAVNSSSSIIDGGFSTESCCAVATMHSASTSASVVFGLWFI